MDNKLIESTEKSIKKILEEGITTNNLDHLYKLSKINHIAKEGKNMNNEYGYNGYYGNYGRNPGYDSYGRDSYGNYGRRGYDTKYRGHEHLDRMYNDYGRYMDSRERYGAGDESDKSFQYMVKALEDFIKVLYEEANTQQQKQMLRETIQRSVM